MKLTNTAAGWIVEGMHCVTIPAGEPVHEDFVVAYFKIQHNDLRFAEAQRPVDVPRAVIMKPVGDFVIVPLTKHVIVETEA